MGEERRGGYGGGGGGGGSGGYRMALSWGYRIIAPPCLVPETVDRWGPRPVITLAYGVGFGNVCVTGRQMC